MFHVTMLRLFGSPKINSPYKKSSELELLMLSSAHDNNKNSKNIIFNLL